MADEVAKLQSHLNLLREEYVKLQTRYAEIEKRYQVAVAAAGSDDQNNFVAKLLKTVAGLFDTDLYSDLTIQLNGKAIKGHRFVLAARSEQWGIKDLSNATMLDLSEFPYEVAHALLKWVYTDVINLASCDDSFSLSLLKAARQFQLTPLAERCEHVLMSSVKVSNCIRFYQTADEIGAESLRQHCSQLISSHWNDFTSEDFASMPASLAYSMFKTKSQYPLHTAIRAQREDVIFLYLVEHNSQLPGKLNEIDTKSDLALDLALRSQQGGIAQTLVKHGVDVDRADHEGYSLLHKAIKRGDEYSGQFLIENKANVNAATKLEKETPLHMAASFACESGEDKMLDGMGRITALLLKQGANVNTQDKTGCTPLHRAIISQNKPVFDLILEEKSLSLELQDNEGVSVLWLALQIAPPGGQYSDDTFAGKLMKKGSSPNAIKKDTGDTLLHLATMSGNETAALFLTEAGGNGSIANQKGVTPLHLACEQGLAKLTKMLLEKGANPNAQTSAAKENGDFTEEGEYEPVYKQTPLHLAIAHKHADVVNIILEFKNTVTESGNPLQIIPNFTLRDTADQTVFGLALWQGFHDVAVKLLSSGANVNDVNSQSETLLHQAIEKQDTASALFLLNQQADINAKAPEGYSCLELAIKRHLPPVVDMLCQKGVNMNVFDQNNNCPLWEALESGQEDIASILVSHGCDTDMWSSGPDDCQHTLLHRAIDENNEPSACFLIRSGCDVNATRRPGPNGEGGDEARDNQAPLHMCASWGLQQVIYCLLEHQADVNAQDVDGKTPLHIAIDNQHHVIISLLLSNPALHLTTRDRHGQTPFAVAMARKNNKAAGAILDRDPTAANQFDNRGRNFLHLAIQKSDIESVLFLISVHVDVNSRIQDSSQLTPLQLAVQAGSEIIVRNLVLAGANVNDITPQKQTCLHLAALHDQASICTVLLEQHIDYDALDDSLNNALHVAVQQGHLATTRILLTESQINAEAVNMRGQNPLHILGQYGGDSAVAIFEFFIECMPQYPIDRPDVNGNTILMSAYFNGNGNLCRAVVRAGARLGIVNREGISIFNAPVATKQLLFRLLDMLSKEPAWVEGDFCQECATKFGIKTRKHHCRHCGRLLCSKCSNKDVPIIKYNITKPVRVCEICFDVLSLGAAPF